MKKGNSNVNGIREEIKKTVRLNVGRNEKSKNLEQKQK
jgi:hypothetical protein